MNKIAIAGLAALILGCSDKPEKITGKRDIFISPHSIAVSECIGKDGQQRETIEWSDVTQGSPEDGWAALKFWAKDARERTRIYARCTLTNPEIYKICPGLSGTDCIWNTSSQFPFYINQAMQDWASYCNKFDCEALEKRWANKEYTDQ